MSMYADRDTAKSEYIKFYGDWKRKKLHYVTVTIS